MVDNVSIGRREDGCVVPLTGSQIIHWIDYVRDGRFSSIRVPQASMRLHGRLDVALVGSCLDVLTRRHESLRTRIVESSDGLTQQIDEAKEHPLVVKDISMLESVEREIAATMISERFMGKEIDISAGPLFDAKLIRLSASDHILLIAIDHIVSDAFSCRIIVEEFCALYRAKGLRSALPELTLQFPDYAVWLERTGGRRDGSSCRTSMPYPSVAARMALRPKRIPSEAQQLVRSRHEFTLGKLLTEELVAAARREKALLSIVILAMCSIAVLYWCRRDELTIGMVTHGRQHRSELMGMVGPLAGSTHIRARVSKSDSLLDVLRYTYTKFCCSYASVGSGSIINTAEEPEVIFNWLPSSSESFGREVDSADHLRVMPFSVARATIVGGGSSSSVLVRGCFDADGAIVMTVMYRDDLWKLDDVIRLRRNIVLCATELVKRPSCAVSELELQ